MEKPQFVNDYMYHLYNRGVEKRTIFLDNRDYFRFMHDLFEFNDSENVLPSNVRFILRKPRGVVEHHLQQSLEVGPLNILPKRSAGKSFQAIPAAGLLKRVIRTPTPIGSRITWTARLGWALVRTSPMTFSPHFVRGFLVRKKSAGNLMSPAELTVCGHVQ